LEDNKNMRKFPQKILLAIVALVYLSYADLAVANNDVIKVIDVQGVQRVDPRFVVSRMSVKVGDEFDKAKLDDSVKRIFKTGLFSDIKMFQEGNALILEVVENPIINKRAFEGNSAISDDILEVEASSRSRLTLNKATVDDDVSRIIDLYNKSGYKNVNVEAKVIDRGNNQVDLVFEIDEGSKTTINTIKFLNNSAYSDEALRSVVSSRESAWYRLLSSSDVFDPDRVIFDTDLIKRHYRRNGYLDFNIIDVKTVEEAGGYSIIYNLDEGSRYTISHINYEANVKGSETSEIVAFNEVIVGDGFYEPVIERSIKAMDNYFESKGRPFVRIKLREDKQENNTVKLTFAIEKEREVYVNRINILGNERTDDSVIRRELLIQEHMPYIASKVRDSERRLRNLGFFEKASIRAVPTEDANKVDLNITLVEQSTGEFSVGAGFSSTESFLFDMKLRERNFRGKGQDVKLSVVTSSDRQEFDIGFTEPYFLEQRLRGNFNVFHMSRDLQDESSFDQVRTGARAGLGYYLSDDLRQNLFYSIRDVEIRDVANDASTFIKKQEGDYLTSSIGQTLTYDIRDNFLLPSSGYKASLLTEVAGLGGDAKYIKGVIKAEYYEPLNDNNDIVYKQAFDIGHIDSYGDDDIRINDKFFVGGNNLRGFEPAGIGPRDSATTDALGGDFYWVGTSEVRFPVGLSEDLGVYGHAFSDYGTLHDDFDFVEDLRATAGVGLSWRSPFGPIRLDFAKPIKDQTGDKTESFRFSFGTQF
jgi:outer membrane protein insertion porin family